jgi:hypothetical protein
MENLEIDPITRRLAEVLFREQPEERIWAGKCCDRVSISVAVRPTKCGACGKPTENVIEIRPEHLAR